MNTKQPRRVNGSASAADELGLIRGITRTIEKRLQACGVRTFRQIGEMTPEDLAAALTSVRGASPARIAQQDWIGQARQLAARETAPAELVNHGFVVDLFLDSRGEIHQTQVLHVKSDHGDAWKGWDSERLLAFLIEQAHANAAAVEEPPLVAADADRVPDGVHLRGVEVLPHKEAPLARGEEFAVKLSFDLDELLRSTTRPLAYKATVRATKKQDGSKVILAETTGRLAPATGAVTVQVPKGLLDAGIYSLRADLAVTRASGPEESPLRSESSIPAGLFQVV